MYTFFVCSCPNCVEVITDRKHHKLIFLFPNNQIQFPEFVTGLGEIRFNWSLLSINHYNYF